MSARAFIRSAWAVAAARRGVVVLLAARIWPLVTSWPSSTSTSRTTPAVRAATGITPPSTSALPLAMAAKGLSDEALAASAAAAFFLLGLGLAGHDGEADPRRAGRRR
jgi:hypothetical protein